jgi:DNA-binding CsgD family transcriptional regulator
MPVTAGLENAAEHDAGAIDRGARTRPASTGAQAATSVNAVDVATADHVLRQHFLRVRRHVHGLIVLVNERVMYANTAAAALVHCDDRALLWEWGSRAAGHGDIRNSALRLTSGLPVIARAWPVEAGGLRAGVLVRLDWPGPEPASGTGRGERRKRPPAYGWPSLTCSERSVAAVIAEGATNREAAARLFLSRHTIDFHLRQIFRKLEINSRVQLTRLVVLHSSPGRSHP